MVCVESRIQSTIFAHSKWVYDIQHNDDNNENVRIQ